MKIAVLGAGIQGTACVYDCLQNPSVTEVAVADAEKARAEELIRRLDPKGSEKRLSAHALDVTSEEELTRFLASYDVVISAVPYFLNLKVTEAAIASKTHMVDMGGNTDLVFEQRKLHEQARAAGVTIFPDCGLAPGMANIVAAHGIGQFDAVNKVQIRVGGLPQEPHPPLNYQLFFSIHGLINEYVGDSVVLRDGRIQKIPTLTEVEDVHVSEPVGTPQARVLEAFHTLGGLSTLPWTYEGKIRNMDYKTIRYPGHCQQIKTMLDLGLLDETPVTIKGQTVVPRDAFAACVIPKLDAKANGWNPEDVVLVLITIEGTRNGKPTELRYELIDRFDPETGFTAMMRTTAFPVAIVAQMMGDGSVTERGVLALETAVPTPQFMAELAKRKINIREAVTSPA